MVVHGVGPTPADKFRLGDSVEEALVNVAGFLAQGMHEAVAYDACDENNWLESPGQRVVPFSASCGKMGQAYNHYAGSPADVARGIVCPELPEGTLMMGFTHATWAGAAPPLTTQASMRAIFRRPARKILALLWLRDERTLSASLLLFLSSSFSTCERPACVV